VANPPRIAATSSARRTRAGESIQEKFPLSPGAPNARAGTGFLGGLDRGAADRPAASVTIRRGWNRASARRGRCAHGRFAGRGCRSVRRRCSSTGLRRGSRGRNSRPSRGARSGPVVSLHNAAVLSRVLADVNRFRSGGRRLGTAGHQLGGREDYDNESANDGCERETARRDCPRHRHLRSALRIVT
jgi:hypothetical protein